MSYEQFYYGDACIARAYHKAEQLRIENQNTFEWLQGIYFYEAISKALANFSAGLAGKKPKEEYRDKPIRITPKTESEKREEERKWLESYIESLKQYKARWDQAQKEKENV